MIPMTMIGVAMAPTRSRSETPMVMSFDQRCALGSRYTGAEFDIDAG
jgi:hypothetical protein